MTDRPWLKNYDAGVPAHLEYPAITLHELFFRSANKYPGITCMRYGMVGYTYLETASLIKRFAASLVRIGITPGKRIGLVLPNCPEFVITYYACLLVGAVVVPLNPVYTLGELELQVRKTQISAIIGWQNRIDLLQQLAARCGISKLILCKAKFQKLANEGMAESSSNKTQEPAEYLFEDLLRVDSPDVVFPLVTQDQSAVFQFSGGTTGTPKAAVALHRNILANALQFKTWLSTLHEGGEQFLTVIPLSHVYGMVIGLNVGIAMGATINLIQDARDTQGILETIQRNRITFFPGVPAMYHAINHNSAVIDGKYDLRTIKACISGSAPLMPEIRARFESMTGSKLVEGYGLSEAPTATHCNPIQGENRNGSIGLPLPDVDCRIEISEDKNDGIGELLIKSPQVMSHYHEEEEDTRNTIVDGWLKTGDYARMDKDGYFYLAGRKKDLIKVGGLQVWPREVEEAIAKNQIVKDVVVAGIPDLARGERVKAWIVLNDNITNPDPEKLRDACANEIAYFKIPSEFEFIHEIPKTPVGKTLRRELVRRELEKEDRE
jgi:long-chain acyl-CoA synthetase